MREILFRGKRVDNGEWVYGLICRVGDKYANIVEKSTEVMCTVLTNTIGQFTGLTNKNGKKIFEGDILKGKFKNYAVWFDDDEKAYVYGSSFQGGYRHSVASYLSGDFKRLEVIGNIYDNPELLEATE